MTATGSSAPAIGARSEIRQVVDLGRAQGDAEAPQRDPPRSAGRSTCRRSRACRRPGRSAPRRRRGAHAPRRFRPAARSRRRRVSGCSSAPCCAARPQLEHAAALEHDEQLLLLGVAVRAARPAPRRSSTTWLRPVATAPAALPARRARPSRIAGTSPSATTLAGARACGGGHSGGPAAASRANGESPSRELDPAREGPRHARAGKCRQRRVEPLAEDQHVEPPRRRRAACARRVSAGARCSRRRATAHVSPSCHNSPSPPSTKKISSSAPCSCAGVEKCPSSTSMRRRPTVRVPASRPRSRHTPLMWPDGQLARATLVQSWRSSPPRRYQ